MEDLFKCKVPVISIVATKSGAGKTTLIEKIIIILKSKGYKVGVIKHNVHKFDIDYPGKDSHRFAQAGADKVVIASGSKLAMIQKLEKEKSIYELIDLFNDVDIIIVEGFKDTGFPKIEIHRKEVDNNLLCKSDRFDISGFIAVASDEPLNINIPILDINSPNKIGDFIEGKFLERDMSHE